MKKRVHITTLCLVALLSGCENEISFNGEETAQQMVLNAIITADSPITARVSNSIFFLSNDSVADITDADVRLYVDDKFVEIMQVKKITPSYEAPSQPQYDAPEVSYVPYWIYSANHVAGVGEKIRIEATAPKFEGKVWAEELVPLVPEVLKIEYNIIDDSSDKPQSVRLKIHLKDSSAKRNCYALMVQTMFHYTINDGSTWEKMLKTDYTDAVFQSTSETGGLLFGGNDNNYSSSEKFFTDDLFGGSDDYSLTVTCKASEHTDNITGFGYRIAFDQISESYYNYRTTKEKYSPENILAEPVQIFNNVVGGIGVVVTCAPSDYKDNYYYTEHIYTED